MQLQVIFMHTLYYLWVVAWVKFLCDWDNVVLQELKPLPLKLDLVHVNVYCGHIFITSSQTLILVHTHTHTHSITLLRCT